MKCNKGDLVRFSSDIGIYKSGLVLSNGHSVSLYVEDRPYRIIDTMSYSVMFDGIRRSVYDYQIEEVLNFKEGIDV